MWAVTAFGWHPDSPAMDVWGAHGRSHTHRLHEQRDHSHLWVVCVPPWFSGSPLWTSKRVLFPRAAPSPPGGVRSTSYPMALEKWFTKKGPHRERVSITRAFSDKRCLRPCPRLTESEKLWGWGPVSCVLTRPAGILMHAEVWKLPF